LYANPSSGEDIERLGGEDVSFGELEIDLRTRLAIRKALLLVPRAVTAKDAKKAEVPRLEGHNAVLSPGKLLLAAEHLGCHDGVMAFLNADIDKHTWGNMTPSDAVEFVSIDRLRIWNSPASSKLRDLVVDNLAETDTAPRSRTYVRARRSQEPRLVAEMRHGQ
jgi:hypothetical protein